MNREEFFKSIKGGLIVSCQALYDEPLNSSFIMGRMARAATEGGAAGIRANSVEDITEIRMETGLPLIGLIKNDYPGSDVYITPTEKEVKTLVKTGVEAIAMDATDRIRPDGKRISDTFPSMRKKYKKMIFMADCADYEDAVRAEELGFDMVGTTLRGYTDDTRGIRIPDFDFIKKLASNLSIPIICEGGIWEPEDLKKAFEAGAYACVIGTAITRPREITRRFVDAIGENNGIGR